MRGRTERKWKATAVSVQYEERRRGGNYQEGIKWKRYSLLVGDKGWVLHHNMYVHESEACLCGSRIGPK